MASTSVEGLSGRQVISIQEGERIGAVKDILIDPESKKVGGLILVGEGGEHALEFGKIVRVGPDAVMVNVAADAQPATQASPEGVKRFGDLAKLPVMSTEGVQLGQLGDAEFDLEGGLLLSVEVRTGGVLGIGQQKTPFTIEKVRSFGTNAVTVETETTA